MDTSKVYSFTNTYSGPGQELAVASDGISLEMLLLPSGTVFVASTNAAWTLSQAASDASDGVTFYRLHTVAGGSGLSLDVLNTDGTASINLQMAATSQVSGQLWRFDSWSDTDAGGGYRLSNNFTGPDMHLDVYSDTLQPHLADGDHTGQHWTLNAAPSGWAPSGSTSSTRSATTTTNTGIVFPTTSSPTSATTPATTPAGNSVETPPPSGSSGLSTGAIAGIAVGGAVGALALIAVLGFVILRYLRQKSQGENDASGGNDGGGGQDEDKDKDEPPVPGPINNNGQPIQHFAELGTGEPLGQRLELQG